MKVKNIQYAGFVNMGGLKIRQPLPSKNIDMLDPFLLLHHHKTDIEKGKRQEDAGVGPHPHRGFVPVTFVLDGEVQHRDSLGNDSTVKKYGTQWTESGNGIIHSERPSQEFLNKGGTYEIIQLWVNTPAELKLNAPAYRAVDYETSEKLISSGTELIIYSGELNGKKGSIETQFPINSALGLSKEGADVDVSFPKNHEIILYVIEGELELNGKLIKEHNLVSFENNGENLKFISKTKSRYLLLSAEPINESVVTYGPFVMNTEFEIQEALHDFKQGNMGDLDEMFD